MNGERDYVDEEEGDDNEDESNYEWEEDHIDEEEGNDNGYENADD